MVTHRDVGKMIVLKGKTRHGKNRVQQHGTEWIIQSVANFQGQPAMFLRSKSKTFKLGDEMIHDTRWVKLRDDPNFIYFW